MEISKRSQHTNNVKLAQLFEIEELEERVEFGKWSITITIGDSSDFGSGGSGSDKAIEFKS